ncbi:hypothetical protein C8R45DRAFT_1044027 [Mycena sanguinolenta]|nr:hypothetical protein C8R45DRAFT_1044027 [Mycena sanguinolenta]
MDGPSHGECPDVWEGSMAQWRDHILAAHDAVAGEVQCLEADGALTPEADTVWMAPQLAELQAALQRDDISVMEREQLKHTLAELWADELEHQRAVAAGYTWDEERGDYWHPLHGYTADEEEEVLTSRDESEVAEELPPLFASTVIAPVPPANPDTPAPMWQRILSLSLSLPRRARSPHRHRTAVPPVLRRLPKSGRQKRAESAPTKRKARRITARRASSCPIPQRDRPPHLPVLDPGTSLTISHPLSPSLPPPKTIVVPRQPGPPDIPCRSSPKTSAVLIVDLELSPTSLAPVPAASPLLLAPSDQRRRNALRRLAKKGKG